MLTTPFYSDKYQDYHNLLVHLVESGSKGKKETMKANRSIMALSTDYFDDVLPTGEITLSKASIPVMIAAIKLIHGDNLQIPYNYGSNWKFCLELVDLLFEIKVKWQRFAPLMLENISTDPRYTGLLINFWEKTDFHPVLLSCLQRALPDDISDLVLRFPQLADHIGTIYPEAGVKFTIRSFGEQYRIDYFDIDGNLMCKNTTKSKPKVHCYRNRIVITGTVEKSSFSKRAGTLSNKAIFIENPYHNKIICQIFNEEKVKADKHLLVRYKQPSTITVSDISGAYRMVHQINLAKFHTKSIMYMGQFKFISINADTGIHRYNMAGITYDWHTRTHMVKQTEDKISIVSKRLQSCIYDAKCLKVAFCNRSMNFDLQEEISALAYDKNTSLFIGFRDTSLDLMNPNTEKVRTVPYKFTVKNTVYDSVQFTLKHNDAIDRYDIVLKMVVLEYFFNGNFLESHAIAI